VRAVSTPLDHTVDLNDVARGDGYLFVRDGVGFAGRGVAVRSDAAAINDVLAAIEHDDQVGGVSPVALGTVPFAPGGPTSFVVPAVVVGKAADGRQWMTVVDGADEALHAPPPAAQAQSFHIAPITPVEHYLHAVEAAREAVRAGRLTKAVIARDVRVDCDGPIDVHAVLRRLRATFGSSYRYSVDGLIGASPELLVAVDGPLIRSHPLAGTAPRTGDPAVDAAAAEQLLASVKDQVEHRVVIDMIHDTLLPWCSYLDWEPEPSVIAVANVQHLATMMEGHLSEPRPDVLELVRALCPTPALGGFPRDAAVSLIAEVEGFERGRYGGAVGWIDAHGNGTWAVTIRCAELSDDRRSARLIAGGGIVARSEPLAELAETQAKLQAMLSAIVRA
jgi:isochorismate synthase